MEYEPANPDIHNFVGSITLERPMGSKGEATPLSTQNMLLKGCKIASDGWIVGLAVYTGQQTKVQMNSLHITRKYGIIDRSVNLAVYLIILIKFLFIFICIAIMFAQK